MGKFFAITVAFARSAQFARAIVEYRRYRAIKPDRHIVVQAHFPIDSARNNEEIRLLCESFGDIELIDPGGDIGSAQSQQYALDYLQADRDDLWTNIDNDSSCRTPGWDVAAKEALLGDPNCVVVSCQSPMVEGFLASRNDKLSLKVINGIRVGIPTRPTPFNLSVFKCSFLKDTGGIRQMMPSWGELEAVIYHEAQMRGCFHGYLLDFFENEEGKYFHPKSNAEWKDKHARTVGPEQFLGTYGEYLRYAYPDLANLTL